jgi:hypothetical protein
VAGLKRTRLPKSMIPSEEVENRCQRSHHRLVGSGRYTSSVGRAASAGMRATGRGEESGSEGEASGSGTSVNLNMGGWSVRSEEENHMLLCIWILTERGRAFKRIEGAEVLSNMTVIRKG